MSEQSDCRWLIDTIEELLMCDFYATYPEKCLNGCGYSYLCKELKDVEGRCRERERRG